MFPVSLAKRFELGQEEDWCHELNPSVWEAKKGVCDHCRYARDFQNSPYQLHEGEASFFIMNLPGWWRRRESEESKGGEERVWNLSAEAR